MSPLYLYNNKLLTENGALAISQSCCCDDEDQINDGQVLAAEAYDDKNSSCCICIQSSYYITQIEDGGDYKPYGGVINKDNLENIIPWECIKYYFNPIENKIEEISDKSHIDSQWIFIEKICKTDFYICHWVEYQYNIGFPGWPAIVNGPQDEIENAGSWIKGSKLAVCIEGTTREICEKCSDPEPNNEGKLMFNSFCGSYYESTDERACRDCPAIEWTDGQNDCRC
jgi:hypothetical protein